MLAVCFRILRNLSQFGDEYWPVAMRALQMHSRRVDEEPSLNVVVEAS
jgi:hypothetical protein